jgi:hypothetical protein
MLCCTCSESAAKILAKVATAIANGYSAQPLRTIRGMPTSLSQSRQQFSPAGKPKG